MSPVTFTDPKELELRVQWLEDLQHKNIVVNLGGTMPPTPTMATIIFGDGNSTDGTF